MLARKVDQFFIGHPAVANVTTLGGMDFLSGGFNSTNAATFFVTLKPFDQRDKPGLKAQDLVADSFKQFGGEKEGLVLAFNPPAIQGLGARAGFTMELQQRGGGTVAELAEAGNSFLTAAGARADAMTACAAPSATHCPSCSSS